MALAFSPACELGIEAVGVSGSHGPVEQPGQSILPAILWKVASYAIETSMLRLLVWWTLKRARER